MEEKKKIAEYKIREVLNQLDIEYDKISEKYKGYPGMDVGSLEKKKLTKEYFAKIDKIKKEYGII